MVKIISLVSGLAIFLVWPGEGTTLTIPNSPRITGSSTNSNLTVEPISHCTKAESWKSPFFHEMSFYLQSCQGAFKALQQDLASYAPYIEYEFVDRSAAPLSTRPPIRLPKMYSSGRWLDSLPACLLSSRASSARQTPLHLRSCTIAIAMIGSLAPGDPLPGQPAGPFGLSETMNTGQLLQSAHQPLLECVLAKSHSRRGWDPSLGWSQAGIHGSVSMP